MQFESFIFLCICFFIILFFFANKYCHVSAYVWREKYVGELNSLIFLQLAPFTIHVQHVHLERMARHKAGIVHDLGSSPRSYKFPYYFSKAIPMCFKVAGASYSLTIYPYTRPVRSDQGHGFKEHATP